MFPSLNQWVLHCDFLFRPIYITAALQSYFRTILKAEVAKSWCCLLASILTAFRLFSLLKGVFWRVTVHPSNSLGTWRPPSTSTGWLHQQDSRNVTSLSLYREPETQRCCSELLLCLFRPETNLDPIQLPSPTSLCNTKPSVPGVCLVPLHTATHQFCIRTGTQIKLAV